jgi:hypothetical protein
MKVTNVESVSSLFAGPDCQHRCSNYAEACPSCGRFFRGYARVIEVTPGNVGIVRGHQFSVPRVPSPTHWSRQASGLYKNGTLHFLTG